MASKSPAHDFLLPKLTALLHAAVQQGIERDVAVAVMIDLVTSPRFDTAAPSPTDDSAPHEVWHRGPDSVVLVGGTAVTSPLPIDARDEADFVKPIPLFGPS